MRLYIANGQYFGTQADARKASKQFSPTDVPTDKAGLIRYLNALRSASSIARAVEAPTRDAAPVGIRLAERICEPGGRAMSAGSVMARSDNPGVDVDGIIEVIGKSSGYALRRFAAAVAVAFQSL